MAVRKPKQRVLTPNERVRERQVEDRARRARPRLLDRSWRGAADRFAREHGIRLELVLDTLDEIASTYLYAGDSWEDAQSRAWFDTVAVLTPRAA